MKKLLLTISLFLIPPFFFNSCEKEIEFQIKKEKVSGFVQKGPFLYGTSILMTELNTSLEQTGKTFNTRITNNRGSFEISNISLTSSFVEFSASGFYYDEVKGDISIAPLNLYALADITDINTVNVNILTHLEKRRVEYLVKQKVEFAEAKKTAQEEILAIFGFENEEMQESETLEIAVNHNNNAILLAISLILQGDRSVGDLNELLAGISTDIVEDGILDNENTLVDLRNSTVKLDLNSIRQNLVGRYESLVSNATIPNFEKYIADFLTYTVNKPLAEIMPATNLTTTGATLKGIVNTNGSSTVVSFEYGLTTDYGSTVTATPNPVYGDTNTIVSADLTGLAPGTTYHFRLKAENELGISYSDDRTFSSLNPGEVYNSTTGKTWMDRNLGASRVATRKDDGNAYGDLYQWGRGTDGHENRNGPTTSTLSSSNSPGHGNFIISTSSPYDWRSPQNTNLWQGVSGTNNPCPAGFRLPTLVEWEAERDSWSSNNAAGAFASPLKLPFTSCRDFGYGSSLPVGFHGYYWSASVAGIGSIYLYFNNSDAYMSNSYRARGLSVRCIKE